MLHKVSACANLAAQRDHEKNLHIINYVFHS